MNTAISILTGISGFLIVSFFVAWTLIRWQRIAKKRNQPWFRILFWTLLVLSVIFGVATLILAFAV